MRLSSASTRVDVTLAGRHSIFLTGCGLSLHPMKWSGLIVRLGAAITAFETSARAVDAHAGKLLAEEIRTSTSAWKAEVARDINIANVRSCEMIDKLNMAHSRPAMIRWGALGLVAGLLLLVGGILLGRYVR